MKKTLRNLILTPLFAVGILSAQALVIPQAPDGAGWAFTLVLTNTTTSAAIVKISFTNGATGEGWTPPIVENVDLGATTVQAASSLFLHSTGTAAALTQGWAQIQTINTAPVQAYIIYTYTSGNSSSSATAQAVTASSASLVPFDNTANDTGTNGTEFAIMNPNQQQETISVNFSIGSSGGPGIAGTPITVLGNQQKAIVMATEFPSSAGQSGLAEFYSTDGSFAIIALRSNTNSKTGLFSFTSAPTYADSGAPIITTSGSSSGGGGGGGTSGSGGTIPAGDITFAGFSVGKTTSSSTVISTVTQSETVGGVFAAYTPTAFNAPYLSGTKIGSCFVYDVTYGANSLYPALPDLFLDAGNIKFAGTGISTPLSLSEATSTFGPSYSLALPTGTLKDGGMYSMDGAGGTQVKTFDVSTTLPSGFSTNLQMLDAVNRTQPLVVNWTGTGFASVVIGLGSFALSGSSIHEVTVSCIVDASLKTFTVPTTVLSHLLAPTTGAASVSTAGAFTTSNPLESTSFTPGLVSGGHIQYGSFSAADSESRSLPFM